MPIGEFDNELWLVIDWVDSPKDLQGLTIEGVVRNCNLNALFVSAIQ